jgi:hypothetical protein
VIRSSDWNIKQDVTKPQRGKKAKFARVYKLDCMIYTLEENLTSLEKMLSSLDNDLWQEVIKDEIDSLESNKT